MTLLSRLTGGEPGSLVGVPSREGDLVTQSLLDKYLTTPAAFAHARSGRRAKRV
jgi:hypothetical protein